MAISIEEECRVRGSVIWEVTGEEEKVNRLRADGLNRNRILSLHVCCQIATGACKETMFSDSADLRTESPGSAAWWGLIQECPAGPTLMSPRSILHGL